MVIPPPAGYLLPQVHSGSSRRFTSVIAKRFKHSFVHQIKLCQENCKMTGNQYMKQRCCAHNISPGYVIFHTLF